MKTAEEIRTTARTNIAKYGFHVIHVFPDEKHPPFSYTVGVALTYGHPEVVVTGIQDYENAHGILHAVVHEVSAGTSFRDGSRSSEVLRGFDVMFIDVAPAFFENLRLAVDIDGAKFAALQCVWPDRSGRFPWENFSDASEHAKQALFTEIRGRPARAE